MDKTRASFPELHRLRGALLPLQDDQDDDKRHQRASRLHRDPSSEVHAATRLAVPRADRLAEFFEGSVGGGVAGLSECVWGS